MTLYNRIDLEDGMMVTIQNSPIENSPGFLLRVIDIDAQAEIGKRVFPNYDAALSYAESCFDPHDCP